MKISLFLSFVAAILPVAAQTFESSVVSTSPVAMRDGIQLSTDIYVPARAGTAVGEKFPVLVVRTPYGKGGERKTAEFFAQHGYVFVAQDVRGRGKSQGSLYPLRDEAPDGYDTIQWAAVQPWSNGKVGTLGASYLGMDQYGAAILKPPALVAMYVAVAGFSYYSDAAYRGGVRGTGWPVWLLYSASTSPKADKDPELKKRLTELVTHPEAWLSQKPADREKIFDGFPDQLQVYRDFYAHPLFDSYWKQPGLDPGDFLPKMKDVPIFMMGGWYDPFSDSMMEGFQKLSKLQHSEKRIWIGPWPHPYGKPVCGQAEFGQDGQLDERDVQLEWFDHWMKNAPWRTEHAQPIRYFRMGGPDAVVKDALHISPGGVWRTASSWPPAHSTTQKLYLGAARTLDSKPGAGKPITYEFHPEDPNPTLGGRSGPSCVVNQTVKRPDVVSFIGEPLQKGLEATGPVRVKLWVSSNRVETDFTARLIDVYPDGYAMNLAEGQIRTSYRNGNGKLEPMQPGKVYELTMDLGSTSNLFETGHRIRLDVSSSSFPRLEPNPNTGESGMWDKRVAATNSLYNGTEHPSYVELTILPE